MDPHKFFQITPTDNGITLTITTPTGDTDITLDLATAALAATHLQASVAAQLPRDDVFQGLDTEPAPTPAPEVPVPLPEVPSAEEPALATPTPPQAEALPGDAALSVPAAFQHLLDAEETTWEFAYSARGRARDLGITEEQMIEAASNPDRIIAKQRGSTHAHAHVRGGISVLIPDDDPGKIIGVMWDYSAPPAASTGTPTGPKGGPGRRLSSSFNELSRQLRDHGFEVIHPGGKHAKVTHPKVPGVSIPIAGSASDRRSYLNFVMEVRTKFGIDISQER